VKVAREINIPLAEGTEGTEEEEEEEEDYARSRDRESRI